MSLALSYAFVPTPNPIRASPSSGGVNRIDLLVLVTAPAHRSVTLTGIVIEIPCGGQGGGYLSSSSLQAVTYDKALPWTITANGSDVQIKPTAGGVLASTLAFTLPQIPVEGTPAGGVVAVNISEHGPGLPGTPQQGPSIVKEPVDFEVVSFRAVPPVLTDVDLPVKLHWTVNDAGKLLGYRIRSRNWSPPETFDAAKGIAGVDTPALDGDTHFTLDVIESGKVAKSVPLTVRVENPRVTNAERERWLGSSNRLLALRWTTEHASRCSVELAGVTVDTSAPVDTYHAPYPLLVGGAAGPTDLGVSAYAATTPIPGQKPLVQIAVSNPKEFDIGSDPQAVAITPDGKFAVVAGTASIVNLSTRTVYWAGIENGNHAAMTAGGLACWCNSGDGAFMRVDAAWLSGSTVGGVFPGVTSLAVTPDGNVALGRAVGQAIVFHMTSGARQTLSVGSSSGDCAITPDGKLGLIVDSAGGNVSVLQLPAGTLEPATIPVDPSPQRIAVAPDGTFALVAGGGSQAPWLARIDIAKRRVSSPSSLALPAVPRRMAISPDGGMALLALDQPVGRVGAVDLNAWSVPPPTLPFDAVDLAIAANGTCVLVADSRLLVL